MHVIYAVFMYLDNHTLAVVKMSESYDILAEALGPLLMEKKSIVVEGKTYCLEIIFGGDLKVRCLDICYYCTTGVITLYIIIVFIYSFC